MKTRHYYEKSSDDAKIYRGLPKGIKEIKEIVNILRLFVDMWMPSFGVYFIVTSGYILCPLFYMDPKQNVKKKVFSNKYNSKSYSYLHNEDLNFYLFLLNLGNCETH